MADEKFSEAERKQIASDIGVVLGQLVGDALGIFMLKAAWNSVFPLRRAKFSQMWLACTAIRIVSSHAAAGVRITNLRAEKMMATKARLNTALENNKQKAKFANNRTEPAPPGKRIFLG